MIIDIPSYDNDDGLNGECFLIPKTLAIPIILDTPRSIVTKPGYYEALQERPVLEYRRKWLIWLNLRVYCVGMAKDGGGADVG